MSGISAGLLLSLMGVLLFGAHQPAGLIFVVVGFVSLFTGMANQQDQKRLKAAREMGQLSGVPMPRLTAGYQYQQLEDERRASIVFSSPTLPTLPVSLPNHPGEPVFFRGPASFTESRQTPRLGGGYMTWDGMPISNDEGEVYVTNRRVYFSGSRELRDMPFADIGSVELSDGIVEVRRRGRSEPIRFGTAFPLELRAFMQRALSNALEQSEPQPYSAGSLAGPAPSAYASYPAAQPGSSTLLGNGARQGSYIPTLPGPEPGPVTPAGSPTFITCQTCGSANGLSANFCQNCASPIGQVGSPTLNYPGPR